VFSELVSKASCFHSIAKTNSLFRLVGWKAAFLTYFTPLINAPLTMPTLKGISSRTGTFAKESEKQHASVFPFSQ